MPLTAYAIGFGTATPVPRHREDAFREMRDLGFDGVALSFSEGEMIIGRSDFEMQVRAAHAEGLKVHAVPSRLGGRLAGCPQMVNRRVMEIIRRRYLGIPISA